MTAYGMHEGWVLKEIDGVEIDGKSYSIEELKAALNPTPVSSLSVTLDRKLGGTGAAYDPPGPQRAYTYEHQPHNGPAYRLGCALSAAICEGGDTIDAGLSLLKALQAHGFGVFEIEPANPTPATSTGGEEAAVVPRGLTDEEWGWIKYNVDRKGDPDIPLWRIKVAVQYADWARRTTTSPNQALVKELRDAADEEDNSVGVQQDFYHAELLRNAADALEGPTPTPADGCK